MEPKEELSRLAEVLSIPADELVAATSLVLKNRGFAEIPEAISLLSNLVVLDLSYNRIQQIPKFLARLTALREINLTGNRLAVVNGDGLSPSLVRIDLSKNKIDSAEPSFFAACTGLTYLSLQTNRLSQLPPEISILRNLIELQVKENRISSLPKEIGALTNLEKLYVHKNALSEIPAEVGNLVKLNRFYAYRNHLTALPETFQNCTMLYDMHVYDNQISRIPIEILSLENLQTLMISSNNFHPFIERIYDSYRKNRGIVLDFSYIKVESLNQDFLQERSLIAPKTLDLSGCHLLEIPDWLFEIDEFQDVSSIDLNKNFLKDLPPSICGLNLQNLSLHGNMQMNPQLQKEYCRALTRKTSALAKCLYLLRPIRRFGPKDMNTFEIYEDYAINIIEKAAKTNTLDQVLDKNIISLAVRAHALKFLSHEKVVEYVDALWVNNASFMKYLVLRKRRVGWFELGFKDGVKCLWDAIRDIGAQRLHSPKTIYHLYSLCYIIYVLLLTVMITTQNVTYVQSSFFFSSSIQTTFDGVNSVQTESQLWDYMKNSFFSTVYEGPYADTSPPIQDYETHPYSNSFRVVGPIRFRQQRAPYKPCSSLKPVNPNKIADEFCVPPLSIYNQETSEYGNGMTFKWESRKQTGSDYEMGSIEFWYPGSGYTYYFSSNATENQSELDALMNAGFVDPQTRVLFLEFIVSNNNLDLVSFVRLMFEFPASSAVIPSIKLNTLTKGSYNHSLDGPFGFQVAILIFTLGFLFHEVQQVRRGIRIYVKDFWNLFDVVTIVLLVSQASMHFSMTRDNTSSEIDTNCLTIGCFRNLYEISTLYNSQKALLSVLSIISWIRLLFLFSIQENLGPMQLGVAYMIRDMITFLAVFAVFMIGFGLSLFTLLATNMTEFSTLRQSGFSIVLYLMGNFDLASVSNVSPILGPFIVIMFVVVCVVLLLNFLIAILSGTYEENRENASKRYRLLFAETVISLSESPLPSPINLLYPIWYVIGPRISNYWETHFASKTHYVRDCENSLEEANPKWASQSRDKSALSFTALDQCSILAKHPWTNNGLVHYFEVEVLCPGANYIGLVYQNYPRDVAPGRRPNTFGFSSYSGGFFQGEQQLSLQVSPLWNKVGDVAGFGIDYKNNRIFLTHQGAMVKSMFPLDTDSPVFPAIGLWNFGSALRVNFGDRPFKFTGLDDWPHYDFQKIPNMPDLGNRHSAERLYPNYFPQKVPKSLQVSPDGLTISFCEESYSCDSAIPSYAFVSSAYEWINDDTSRYSMKVEILNLGEGGSFAIGILSRLSQRHNLLDKDSSFLSLEINSDEKKCQVRNKLTGQSEVVKDIPWQIPESNSIEVEIGVCFVQKMIFIRLMREVRPVYCAPFSRTTLKDLYPTVGLSAFGQCALFQFTHIGKDDEGINDLDFTSIDPADDPLGSQSSRHAGSSDTGRGSVIGRIISLSVSRYRRNTATSTADPPLNAPMLETSTSADQSDQEMTLIIGDQGATVSN